MITSIDQLDPDKIYTYADYLKWQFDEYVELIRGKIFKMTPAPSSYHQSVNGNLHGEFYQFLKGKTCKLFTAPFDVRLIRNESDEQTFSVVQPDLCIVCDSTKIDSRGCHGAPDLIVEIISPYTSRKDVRDKFDLYEEAGVTEYWLVEPVDKMVDVFVIKDNRYNLIRKYVADDLVPVNIFPGFSIDLKDIFID